MAHPLPAMGPAAPGGPAAEPFQQLEAVMLRQMLQSSGAFRGSDSPGAQLRADLFVETLAEAVAKAGGLGIGRMLERQLGGGGAATAAAPPASPSASPHRPLPASTHVSGPLATRSPLSPASFTPSTRPPMAQVSRTPASRAPVQQVSMPQVPGTADSLEDPNCDAPLPEDPSADSIDDYQPPAPARSAARPSFSASRALIRYRERAEVQGADHPSRASGGK
jgi:Rod binding domain-containing protein